MFFIHPYISMMEKEFHLLVRRSCSVIPGDSSRRNIMDYTWHQDMEDQQWMHLCVYGVMNRSQPSKQSVIWQTVEPPVQYLYEYSRRTNELWTGKTIIEKERISNGTTLPFSFRKTDFNSNFNFYWSIVFEQFSTVRQNNIHGWM